MTPLELESRASALYGPDWQSPFARRVRVDARTVRRWKAENNPIPNWVGAFLDVLERNEHER